MRGELTLWIFKHKTSSISKLAKSNLNILNKEFKNENVPTNVLSFEGNLEEEKNLGIQPPFLGDLIICFPVVKKEAIDQEKNFAQHFAHILVHGFLHLLGFDHLNNKDKKSMQDLENIALKDFFMLRQMD